MKTLGLAAAADAINGQIGLAQDKVSRSLDAEFAPIQSELDYYKTALSVNQDNLSTAQKNEATQVQTALQERQNLIDQQKTDKSAVYSIMLQAAQKGADASTLQKIQSAQTPEDAVALASKYLQPVQPTQANQIIHLADGTTALINPQTGQIVKNYGGAAPTGGGTGVGGIPTLSGKPQSQTQALVQGYADRTTQADQTISKLGSHFTGLSSYVGGALPNFLKTADRQLYEQAESNFVNAVLRRESGSAISSSEFSNARQQYFPQPGDSAAVIAQKAQNRQTVINSLYNASNIQRPASSGSIIEDSSGKQYVVGEDGQTLTPL